MSSPPNDTGTPSPQFHEIDISILHESLAIIVRPAHDISELLRSDDDDVSDEETTGTQRVRDEESPGTETPRVRTILGTTFLMSDPQDIIQPVLPRPISDSNDEGFYVGTVRDRDPELMSLRNFIAQTGMGAGLCDSRRDLDNNYTPAEVEMLKANVPFFITKDSEKLFFFDRYSNRLLNEKQIADSIFEIFGDKYAEHFLDKPIEQPQPIANYADIGGTSRRRHSANERVHPDELYTMHSRAAVMLEIPFEGRGDPFGEQPEMDEDEIEIRKILKNPRNIKVGLNIKRRYGNRHHIAQVEAVLCALRAIEYKQEMWEHTQRILGNNYTGEIFQMDEETVVLPMNEICRPYPSL